MFRMVTGDKELVVKFHHFQNFDDDGHLNFAQTFCVLEDLNAEPQILGRDFIYNSMYIDSECNTSLCKNNRRKYTLGRCLQEFYPSDLEGHKELRREVWNKYFATQENSRPKEFWWKKLWGIFNF